MASDFEYRKKLVEIVPNLTQIDATMVGWIGQHGYLTGGGSGDNLLERMRQMQDQVIQKAAAETEASGSKEDE